MGKSRMDRIRRMTGKKRLQEGGKRDISMPMLLLVIVAGLWAMVRFVMAICYFF